MPIRKASLRGLSSEIADGVDLFICSASFEDRCLSITSALDIRRVRKSIVCQNRSSYPQMVRNAQRLKNLLSRDCTTIMMDKVDPLLGADSLRRAIDYHVAIGGVGRVVVDITTFTHESLLILIRLLHDRRDAFGELIFAYAAAADYSVGSPPGEEWLGKGIRDIRSVLGYPGAISAAKGTHLILLVGYERDRAEKLIDQYEPRSLALGYGDRSSSMTEHHHRVNLALHRNLMSKYRNCTEFRFHPNDPFSSCIAIEAEIARPGGLNIVLAPMNTKLSTLGAALACFRHQQVQLCYASAMKYNVERYSLAGQDCYIVDEPFGARHDP